MEAIVYYSRNARKTPFEVTVEVDGQTVYINCNCDLGIENKICRHKINAIRGDKQKRHELTSDEVIKQLRRLFGNSSTVRQHLEEKWRLLREYAGQYPENEEEISNKRRILGEAFANGFVNENIYSYSEPFDIEEWEDTRETYARDINCPVALKYFDNEGVETARDVIVDEVFENNDRFYILGFCKLRNQNRTFRVDRIHGMDFSEECDMNTKSMLVDLLFKGLRCSNSDLI